MYDTRVEFLFFPFRYFVYITTLWLDVYGSVQVGGREGWRWILYFWEGERESVCVCVLASGF